MLNNEVYYHGSIRKSIIAFGRLFSDIYIDRKEDGSVNGNVVQRLHIPVSYAPKEKWLVRIEQDPTLEGRVYTTLPRISFEILGYTYDSSRKMNRMQQMHSGNTSVHETVRTPVPYNLDINLYILTKTQEDGMQIIEQILPTFTPEYTLKVNMLDELGITMDVPVILNNISVVDEYNGAFDERRFVTHTLGFQMKANLFGAVSNKTIITQVESNIGEDEHHGAHRVYVANGNPSTHAVVNEGWSGEGL